MNIAIIILLAVSSILCFFVGFSTLIWVFTTPGQQPVEAFLGGLCIGWGIGFSIFAGLLLYEELT